MSESKKAVLFGMIANSSVYVIAEDFEYPKPNTYADIAQVLPSVGGEAANSAVVLAKFGVKTSLYGNWLSDGYSDQIFRLLEPFAMDLKGLTVKSGYRGLAEIVMVDKHTRTVFGRYAAYFREGPQYTIPTKKQLQGADIVGLDPFFKPGSQEVAELCVKLQIPYVTIDEKYEEFITRNAECVIISEEFLDREYKGYDYEILFEVYRQRCPGLLIFTFGSRDVWFARCAGTQECIGNIDDKIEIREKSHFTPFKIDPVDTTGAGDSFRGGVMYGLLQGWEDEKVVEFACAVAADVCMHYQHALNIGDLNQILDFIKKTDK